MARISDLKSSALLALAATLLLSAPAALAQDDEEEELDRTPEDCIAVNRIDRDVGVDGQTILFFMRGGVVFRNNLPAVCQNLKAGETRFTYNYTTQAVRLPQLCDTDSISLERYAGLACRLGMFNPITRAEADALLNKDEPAAAGGQN